jgi:hypothetical protein
MTNACAMIPARFFKIKRRTRIVTWGRDLVVSSMGLGAEFYQGRGLYVHVCFLGGGKDYHYEKDS